MSAYNIAFFFFRHHQFSFLPLGTGVVNGHTEPWTVFEDLKLQRFDRSDYRAWLACLGSVNLLQRYYIVGRC